MLQQWPAIPGGSSSSSSTSSSSAGSSSSSRGYADVPTPAKQPRLNAKQINSRIKNAFGPEKLLQLVEQHGPDLDPVHVSTAYSKLGQWCKDGQAQSQQAEVQSVLQLLEPLVQQQVSKFGAWSLANIIHACNYLGSKHTVQQLLPVFLQAHSLNQADTQEVANVLWAAAKAGLVLQDSELQQLLGHLCAQLQHAKPQEIANSIYAAALMGKQVPDQQLQQLLGRLCAKLHDAKPQEIANSIWAVADMGKQLPDQLLQQLVQALAANLQRAKPQHISNTLYGVAILGKQLPDQQLQQLVQALCGKLTYAGPQNISNTLYGVATMGKGLPDQQLQQLDSGLCDKLGLTKPQEVANSLWACGRLRFLPGQLLAALEQQPEQRQRLLPTATGQDVGNMALACGQLGHKGQLLMAALLCRAQQLQEQPSSAMTEQGCCNISWAVAVLDLQQHAQQVLQLAAACGKMWDEMVPEGMRQLYQVHLWLQECQLLAGGGKGLLGVLTQQQLEECRTSWQQQLAATASGSGSRKFQRTVYEAFQRLPAATWRKPPALEQPLADWAAVVDIFAVTASGTLLAIEADGPTHVVRPGRMLSGPTQHRNRVLEARGFTVVSIPYWEWQWTWTPSQQQAYLLSKLKGL